MNRVDETGLGDTSDRGPWMQTYSGRAFFLLNPRTTDVETVDLAHHLALQCRFAGATIKPYSVAQHCVLVSHIVPKPYAIYGLMHDAAEAYCQDMTRPMKLALQRMGDDEFLNIESDALGCIFARYGIDYSLYLQIRDVIKHADNIACATEARDLLHRSERPWGKMEDPLPTKLKAWSWKRAKQEWLRRFNELLPHGRVVTPAPIEPRPLRYGAFGVPAFARSEL